MGARDLCAQRERDDYRLIIVEIMERRVGKSFFIFEYEV